MGKVLRSKRINGVRGVYRVFLSRQRNRRSGSGWEYVVWVCGKKKGEKSWIEPELFIRRDSLEEAKKEYAELNDEQIITLLFPALRI